MSDAMSALVEVLQRRPRRAAFVVEVRSILSETMDSAEEFERALDELQRDHRLLLSTHTFSDPHLCGLDLRIVGLVEQGVGDSDPVGEAVAHMEQEWQAWLSDFLQEHRCG